MQNKRAADFLEFCVEVFGEPAKSVEERTLRLLEEVAEAAQAAHLPRSICDKVLDRVYSRPAGSLVKELGQCQLTLELLGQVAGVDLDSLASQEANRCYSIPKEEWRDRHKKKAEMGITSTMSNTDCIYCDLMFPRDRRDGDVWYHPVGLGWVLCTRREK